MRNAAGHSSATGSTTPAPFQVLGAHRERPQQPPHPLPRGEHGSRLQDTSFCGRRAGAALPAGPPSAVGRGAELLGHGVPGASRTHRGWVTGLQLGRPTLLRG